jgi:hypothetical protein
MLLLPVLVVTLPHGAPVNGGKDRCFNSWCGIMRQSHLASGLMHLRSQLVAWMCFPALRALKPLTLDQDPGIPPMMESQQS